MHTPINLFLVGATALCLTTFAVNAKDTDEDAKLREAMRNKISETNPQTAPAAPAAVPAAPVKPAATATPVKTAAPVKPVEPATTVVATTAPAASNSDTDALREAMRARMAGEATTATTTPAATTAAATAATVKSPAKATGFTSLTPPASPLPAAKQQRLQALLEQYKTDQLTPEQYHAQRAKIIAE